MVTSYVLVLEPMVLIHLLRSGYSQMDKVLVCLYFEDPKLPPFEKLKVLGPEEFDILAPKFAAFYEKAVTEGRVLVPEPQLFWSKLRLLNRFLMNHGLYPIAWLGYKEPENFRELEAMITITNHELTVIWRIPRT